MTKIYNLALGGTGLDGSAFVGALRQFNRSTINNTKHLKRVVGSATGAIVAMMVALGYTVDEMERIFHDDFTMHKLENKKKSTSTAYDGDKLESLIRTIIKRKTGNEDFTFGELDANKGFKQLYIITMMVFMQKDIPKIDRHVFNQEHTAKTKIKDAVLASASVPGMYPIVFLDKREDSNWAKGEEFHHIPRMDSIPLEEFFDKKDYLSEVDEKPTSENPINLETLSFITHDNTASSARLKPIPTTDSAKLLYALTTALKEDLLKSEQSSHSPRKKIRRTVLLTIANPITYPSTGERKLEASAAETSVREHFMMQSIEEEKKTESSSSQSVRSRLSGLFSSAPVPTPSPTESTEIKPQDEPQKKKRCVMM
jgi:hypothetical protein